MSVISAADPAGTEAVSLGASRMRGTRVWLYDAWQAFKGRHQDGGTPNDPGTSTGAFKVPSAAPAIPGVGDFYITAGGSLIGYKAGPTAQYMGDFENATLAVFQQASAPTGWTRNTALTTASFLRYIATGAPSAGGAVAGSVSIAHSAGTTGFNGISTPFSAITSISDHSAYKYQDIIMATK
jgi:hypothetical protein